jgi:hypothetical protein
MILGINPNEILRSPNEVLWILLKSNWNPTAIQLKSYEIHMKFIWNPIEIPMKSLWNPYEIHMKSLWNLYEILMKSLWNPYEILMKSYEILMKSSEIQSNFKEILMNPCEILSCLDVMSLKSAWTLEKSEWIAV